MEKVFSKPKSIKNNPSHYCPGCGHGIIHRIIGEVIDEMRLQEVAIGIPPAGCAVLAYNYFDIDMGEAPHGRGAAVATGIKRILPDRLVFTYQGDGDIAAIGTAETIHAANRGENITAILVNNGVYGMTGGQMAPTTLLGQKTTTSPNGRGENAHGHPIKLSEMLALTRGSSYVVRTAVNSAVNIQRTKKAIAKAFQIQLDALGFSLVEILSPCPTNWKMDPIESCQWIEKHVVEYYPLGVITDITGSGSLAD